MGRSRLLWLGLTLIVLAMLWHFAISLHWRQRFPAGWGQEFNFIGISTLPDWTTGQFPATDSTGLYQRGIQLVERTKDSAVLQDHYIIRDPNTDEISYNYTFRAEVDPMTGAHLDEQYRGDYYLFPREVQKTTYRIRHSYIKGVPLAFKREEVIEGLRVYLFSYYGSADYPEAYLNLTDESGRSIEAGQTVRCADDQFRLDIWVEPFTGEMLKIDESCYAGDYVYDIATARRLFPVLRWGGVTAGDDVQARSDDIRRKLSHYLWATRYVPLLLAGNGVGALATFAVPLLGAAWACRRSGRKAVRYA